MMIGDKIWEPCQAVGDFIFGSEEGLLNGYGLELLPNEEESSVGWNVYGLADSLRVYCEDGKVISIAVYDALYFDGVNLIGCSFEVIRSLFPNKKFLREDPIEMSNGVQIPYSCDELGVQFWLDANNKVLSCSCDDGKL